MANEHDPKGARPREEPPVCGSREVMALFNLLERKGLVTRAEFREEVRKLREEAREAGLPADAEPHVVRD